LHQSKCLTQAVAAIPCAMSDLNCICAQEFTTLPDTTSACAIAGGCNDQVNIMGQNIGGFCACVSPPLPYIVILLTFYADYSAPSAAASAGSSSPSTVEVGSSVGGSTTPTTIASKTAGSGTGATTSSTAATKTASASSQGNVVVAGQMAALVVAILGGATFL
jgi:hypothetical protein